MDSPRNITLNCSSHNETLIKGLWKLFNLKHGLDCDFQYLGRTIRAHQLVVDVFFSTPNAVQRSDLQMGSVTREGGSSTMLSLIEFMYTGTVTVTEEQINDLMALAQETGFQMLVDTMNTARSKRNLADRSPGGADSGEGVVAGRSGLRQRKAKPVEPSTDRQKRRRIATASPSSRINCASQKKVIVSQAVKQTGDLPNDQPTEGTGLSQTRAPTGRKRRKTEQGAEIAKERPTPTTESAEEVTTTSLKVTRHTLWRRRRPLLKCEQCDYQNRCKVLLTVHMAKHDSTISVFRCGQCSQAFLDQASLDRHLRKHVGKPDMYRCPHCPYKNRQNSWYQLHLQSKHGTASVPVDRCPTCGRPFLTAEAMARHKCVREKSAVHACPHCEFKTSRLTFYRRHLAKHDPNVAVHRCDMCSQAFLSLPALTAHRSAHTSYSCRHCSFDTRKSNVYYHHLYAKHRINTKGETVPEKVKKYRCQDCDYRCVQLSELKIHRTAKHSPELPFHCQHCSFSSGRKGNVVRHIKWVHLGQRSEQFWMCELCGHKTRTQAKLADHKRRHTDDKPHTCTICKKQYKDRTSFKRHVLRHDRDTKEFLCHLCSFCCNRLDNLKGHLKRIHSHVS